MSHTLGPWRATYQGGNVWGVCTDNEHAKTIRPSVIPGGLTEGDAKFIAAAPEMEATLRFVLSCFDPDMDALIQPKRKELLETLRATITKLDRK